MSMPRYRAIESSDTISAPIRWASSTPTADLPEAVGPVRNHDSRVNVGTMRAMGSWTGNRRLG